MSTLLLGGGKIAKPNLLRQLLLSQGPPAVTTRAMVPSTWITHKNRHYTAWCRGDLPERLVRRIAVQPDDFIVQNAGRPVKISRESLIVVADLALGESTVPAAFKRYAPRTWWKAVAALFRPSRAFAACRRAQALAAHGIPTALPLAAIQPRGFRSPGVSFLATQWIEGAENLHLYGWRLAELPPAVRRRSAVACAESLGHLLGRMHAAGIDHRDLKAPNLLAVERNGDVTTFVVDLDGVRLTKALDFRRRVANLARLAVGLEAHPWVGRTLVLRFFRAYLAESSAGSIGGKRLWRAIARESAGIIRRKKQRGQPVL
jgi:Lipopolysaccharide kinase (Kdo/WaaP) family